MKGKVLKVFTNDLNEKDEDKQIYLLACFNHIKYMNKYAIFTFKQDVLPQKIYYGSVFIKENAIVIFGIKEELKPVILAFTEQYKNNNLTDFELVDINNIQKVELVNYSETDYNDINTLYNIAFPIQNNINNKNTKKKSPLGILLFLLILIVLGCGIYYYLNNKKENEKKYLCTINSYNYDLNLEYDKILELSFDNKNIIKENHVTEIYKFKTEEEYNDFKNNNKQNEHFNIKGTYKYVDTSKELKIFYQDIDIATNYEQINSILTRQGYTCKEVSDE